MRAVVQRVTSAKVEVSGATTGAIEHGLLVYLGVGKGDTDEDRAYVLRKVIGLRVFPDESGKMMKSVTDVGGALLVVSQFTLYGDVRKGARPSFDLAMPPDEARATYDAFVRDASARVTVATGRFGADMKVTSVNDGPVTLLVDSRRSFDRLASPATME
jgi:D-tyrosyl-tRNA(Tyr) deacylase